MSVVYDDLETYDRYKSTFDKYAKVDVLKTKYSIKIDYNNKKKVLLAKDRNDGTNILGLINRVKEDTKKFINGEKVKKTNKNPCLSSLRYLGRVKRYVTSNLYYE